MQTKNLSFYQHKCDLQVKMRIQIINVEATEKLNFFGHVFVLQIFILGRSL
jgi:hypothetical protein